MPATQFFYAETSGIRVTVRPTFLQDQSRPAHGHYVFVYRVRLENVGPQTVTLLTRRWRIYDSVGEESEVAGEGVIGEKPTLQPGRVHEYQSFCVLKSPRGYMEGHYGFVREGGALFDVRIPRFTLDAADPARP